MITPAGLVPSSAFRPHPWLRGPHGQTLLAHFFPGEWPRSLAAQRLVALPDGDRIVLHDDSPAGWQRGDRVALLLHGLGGCHQSHYMQRIAAKLAARGVRAFRMDMRGCGAGLTLARRTYHAGSSDDLLAVTREIGRMCPDSPLALVGFSLGGNVVLKLLGESPDEVPPCVERAVAVCPPVDLETCVRALHGGVAAFYDRYFCRLVWRQIRLRRHVPGAFWPGVSRAPRTLFELDDVYTAPAGGFHSAQDYYRNCSAGPHLRQIRVPTLVLASWDDPLVPTWPWRALSPSEAVVKEFTDQGGHMGFIDAATHGGDRRWMDRQVVGWVMRGEPSA